MNDLAVIQQINLTPSLAFYAERQGFDPNFCKVEIQFHKAKIQDKTFLAVEYVENLVAYSNGKDDSGNDIQVSEIINSYPFKRVIPMFIHKDLENAFKKLTAHVIFINCLVSDDKYNSLQEMQFESLGLENEFEAFWTDWEQREANDHEYRLLNRINVLGVSFSGAGENESVSIVAKIKNQYSKEYVSITPLVKIEDIEEKYFFAKDLNTAVENLKKELIAYMYYGKVGDVSNNAPELPFDYNENQD